jgi:ABC-type amino acid transport system permease subunit
VGVVEILNYAGLYKSQYFNLSPITGAAIAYLIITIPVTRFVDYLIRIDKERTQAQ